MSNFEEFKAKGNESFKHNDYFRAADFYKEAIKHDPSNPVGYSNCAMALIKLGDYSDAAKMCERGLYYVSESTDPEGKIQQKLRWRLDICRKHTADGLISVEINEVDSLPEKYQRL